MRRATVRITFHDDGSIEEYDGVNVLEVNGSTVSNPSAPCYFKTVTLPLEKKVKNAISE